MFSRTDLEAEAYLWEDNISDVLSTKNRTLRSISSPNTPEGVALDRYLNTLKSMGNILTKNPTRIKFSQEINDKKTEYRMTILNKIDEAKLSAFDLLPMTLNLEEISTDIMDYGWGHIALAYIEGAYPYQYLHLKDPTKVADSKIERIIAMQNSGKNATHLYLRTMEQNRQKRKEDLMQEVKRGYRRGLPKTIFAGRGDYDSSHSNPVAELLFNLEEFIEPNLQVQGLEENRIEEFKTNISETLNKIYRLQKSFDKKLRTKILLVRHPEVIESLVDRIRVRTEDELVLGHPYLSEIKKIIKEDETLYKVWLDLIDIYINVFGSQRYCGQATIYDVLDYIIFGDVRLQVINSYFREWGLPPIELSQTNLVQSPDQVYPRYIV